MSKEFEELMFKVLRTEMLSILFQERAQRLQQNLRLYSSQVEDAIRSNLKKVPEDTANNVSKKLIDGLDKFSSPENTERLVLSMILCQKVQDFEFYLIQMLKKVFKKHPSIFRNAEIRVSIEDIAKYESIEQIVSERIEMKVRDLSYKSLYSLIEYLNNKNGSIKLGFDTQMQSFIDGCEMFQTRNIFVHNNGIIDKKYLENIKTSNLENGSIYPINKEYVSKSGSILLDLGMELDKKFISHFSLT
jgi:hypothetical protein